MNESKFQKLVIKYLNNKGYYVEKRLGSMMSRGLPDLFCIKGNVFFNIELKVSHKVTKLQALMLIKIPNGFLLKYNTLWQQDLQLFINSLKPYKTPKNPYEFDIFSPKNIPNINKLTKESSITLKIVNYLKQGGAYCERRVSGFGRSDYIFYMFNTYFEIEFKSNIGKLSKNQILYQDKMKKYNVNIFTIGTQDQLLNFIKKLELLKL